MMKSMKFMNRLHPRMRLEFLRKMTLYQMSYKAISEERKGKTKTGIIELKEKQKRLQKAKI